MLHPLSLLVVCLILGLTAPFARGDDLGLTVSWKDNFLTIRGDKLPGREMKVLYLEAYCRPDSHDRDWHETVIGHTTELISASPDGKKLRLRCRVKDGVEVDHEITAGDDSVDFRLKFVNPTDRASAVHWAQPCIRVGEFTGADRDHYIPKCFVFLQGKLTRLPTQPWATTARYVPGQVYRPASVAAKDVNPRPLSELIPSPGIIGCYSRDDAMVMATVFEPWQELFQGVAHCVHADFRVGGLSAGETKQVHGKIFFLPAREQEILERVRREFPGLFEGR